MTTHRASLDANAVWAEISVSTKVSRARPGKLEANLEALRADVLSVRLTLRVEHACLELRSEDGSHVHGQAVSHPELKMASGRGIGQTHFEVVKYQVRRTAIAPAQAQVGFEVSCAVATKKGPLVPPDSALVHTTVE